MNQSLAEYYDAEKDRVVETCLECGLCAGMCPVLEHTGLKDTSPEDIQKEVRSFLMTGQPGDVVYARSFSCMECFKCVEGVCPVGLNPLMINEIVRWEYRRKEIFKIPVTDPRTPDFPQRVLAGLQVSRDDYGRITRPTGEGEYRYIFFPGCNVYFQPEKILNALDLLDLLTDDCAFVPGLDYCCADVFLWAGAPDRADGLVNDTIDKLASYKPEAVILWCPTCLCRFKKTIAPVRDLPFETMSFAQFLTLNKDRLPLPKPVEKTVTLHEACKTSFTGLDLTGPREILGRIQGLRLREMPRHGRDTACCGSGAVAYFPQALAAMRDTRLAEAAGAGAEVLVDVCHYCHYLFTAEEHRFGLTTANYVNLIAEAAGIEREDKLRKYRQWNDLERILEDAREFIEQSPFGLDRIKEEITRNVLW